MSISNQRMLEKAALSLADFGGAGEAPLTIEQINTFLRLAITPQVMLNDVRTVMSNASKWQESKLNFDERILRVGTEGVRNVENDRVKPGTGIVEISTTLLRGEIPISDEVMEDQVERAGFGNTVMTMAAEAVGRDIEELMINASPNATQPGTNTADTFLRAGLASSSHGWFYQAQQGSDANVVDFNNEGPDYQTMFNRLLTALPDRYKREKANMRFYVPVQLEEKYRDQIAQRGTALGDAILEGSRALKYQEIPIVGVPLININGNNETTVLLSHKNNLYAGYRRQVRLQNWYDPREGQYSFVVSTRVDAKVAHVPATAVGINVDVTP